LTQMRSTGQSLFKWITGIQAMLVLIIAPTITAGMTTGEKEKKTFEFLRVTTITPWMYVLGSFLSTVFYVSLALLCALPLISLSFLYGGVGRNDVIASGGMLLGASMVLSSFGLFISSVRERTRTAQGIVVFLIFALILADSSCTSASAMARRGR
ncbi:MAG: ABC transporter permease, partial [Methylacidiphilales bacterium]|nr:ABC transporter permease [Candidatus Methylacidiphilales bacterium]